MELAGTVAIVTGGGTGIGKAVSESLGRAGARAVAVNYARSQKEAEETARELSRWDCEGVAFRADVSDEGQVKQMVAEVVERFGRLDVLVNNAGTTRYVFMDLDLQTDELWDEIVGTNLKGMLYCTRAAAPHLKKARGAIVNIASVAGHRAGGSSLTYGVSKAGVIQLTRACASTLAPEVRVNSVSPGQVATRWAREKMNPQWAEEIEARVAQTTPLHDVARPEHVAQAVMAFLSMDFVTGQDLIVDGGKTITA
jgi:NAD(P)-dependent dehydrogenase (short-subunit alcohol dehydrogenase family)